jgi:hypothetical protein
MRVPETRRTETTWRHTMIRNTAAGLAALAVLTAAALAIPAAAQAAVGPVIVNGQFYIDPSGCTNIQDAPPLDIQNYSSSTVVVFAAPGCNGDVTAILNSGDSRSADDGASFVVS